MLISLNDFYPVFCLHICFLIEKITKPGKENPLWACWNTFIGGQIFRINTENACKRGYLFRCILRAICRDKRFHIGKEVLSNMKLTYSPEWNAMKIICKRVRLDYTQIFPPGRQTSTPWSGCGGGAGEGEYSMRFWAGVSSVTQEPLAFTTQCSILPP